MVDFPFFKLKPEKTLNKTNKHNNYRTIRDQPV